MLGSSGQCESRQDTILAEIGIVKKLVAQNCGTVRPVAYFSLGKTGTELVYADPQGMFLCSFEAMAIAPKN